jgi:hypothetical protein
MAILKGMERRFASSTWVVAAALAALVVSCTSMSGPPYKASSLRVFATSQVTRLDEPDFTFIAGRLRGEEETVRVLGQRSGQLATECVVVQVAVTAGVKPVLLGADSLRLQFSSGETVEPLTADQVLAAVSLPEDYWKTRRAADSLSPPTRPSLPGDQGVYPAGEAAGVVELIITGIDLAVHRAGAEQYRDQARADVEEKTALLREAPPGTTLDLLLVYLPPPKTSVNLGPVHLILDIGIGGRRVERHLILE